MGYNYIKNDRGAREFVIKKGEPLICKNKIPIYASTLGSNIYWQYNMNNIKILKHELSHVEDFKKFGIIGYLTRYIIYNMFFGYDNNPFEIKARKAEEE